jgi:sn-glycerol 3-phosphate transport system ATP-binding protein/multiple sugar transport system ATP-binding protein
MATLTLKGIHKSFAAQPILRGIDLAVKDGEFVVLVGPSGCGKSTLLRTIAGLEAPDAGSVLIDDREVTSLPPKDRDVGMVFQSYALYPHLTVRENLSFGLSLRREPKELVTARVTEASRMLGLGELLDRYPRQLSGGQRQRVAMGRAIARRPRLFLFDEPLSNLDAALRAEVRVEIKRLHERLGATMIYVTHDQVEAMTLADRLVILNRGVIEQEGPPLEVYDRPRSRFVGSFMGSPPMNFLPARVVRGSLEGQGILRPLAASGHEGEVLLGVRPHDLRVDASQADLSFAVDVIEPLGFEAYAHGTIGGSRAVLRLEAHELANVRPGNTLPLRIEPDKLRLFRGDAAEVGP